MALEDDADLPANMLTPGVVSTAFHINHASDFTRYFVGALDELALYPRVLQPAEVLEHANAFLSAVGIAGDYNDSGLVEQGDLDLVLSNWGDNTPPVPSGWTNDLPTGQIDQAELDKVLAHWGDTSAPDSRGSGVPEPAAGLLCLAMMAGTMRQSSGRRPGGRAAAAL